MSSYSTGAAFCGLLLAGLIAILPVSVQAENCILHVPDIGKMEFVGRNLLRLKEGRDYDRSLDFGSDRQNVTKLGQLGYTIKKDFFMYGQEMLVQGAHQFQNHFLRVNSEGRISIRKLLKDSSGKPLMVSLQYANLSQIPNCKTVDAHLLQRLQMRDMYLQALHLWQTQGSWGEVVLRLESIAKMQKGQSVDLDQSLKAYAKLLNEQKKLVRALGTKASFDTKLETVRKGLLKAGLVNYVRSQTLLTGFLSGSGANCVGNTIAPMVVLHDLGIAPSAPFEFGIEIFNDHVQLVQYSATNRVLKTVLAKEIVTPPVTPILKQSAALQNALFHFRTYAFTIDTIQLASISDSDYLYKTQKIASPQPINIDQLIGSGSALAADADERAREQAYRIDIFNWSVPFAAVNFSDGDVPATANLSSLLAAEFRNGRTLGGDQGEGEERTGGAGRLNQTEHIEPDNNISDPAAVRMYNEAFRRGFYSEDDIAKYGSNQLGEFFPANSGVRQSPVVVESLEVFDTASGSMPSLLGHVDDSDGFGLFVSRDKAAASQLRRLPMMKRYKEILNQNREALRELTARLQLVNSQLQSQPNLGQVNDITKQIMSRLSIIKSAIDAAYLLERLHIVTQQSNGFDFIEHNAPGFKHEFNLFITRLNDYFLNRLRDPHTLVMDFAKISGDEIREMTLFYFELEIASALSANFRNPYNPLPVVVRYMLRNSQYFYTSEFSERESQALKGELKELNKPSASASATVSPAAASQTKVDNIKVPKVMGFLPCDQLGNWIGGMICSLGGNTKAQLNREMVLLPADVFVNLVGFGSRVLFEISDNDYQDLTSITPMDALFLALAWRDSHNQYLQQQDAKGDFTYRYGKTGYSGPYSIVVLEDSVVAPVLRLNSVYDVSFGKGDLESLSENGQNCSQNLDDHRRSHCFLNHILEIYNSKRQSPPAYPDWVSDTPVFTAVYDFVMNHKDLAITDFLGKPLRQHIIPLAPKGLEISPVAYRIGYGTADELIAQRATRPDLRQLSVEVIKRIPRDAGGDLRFRHGSRIYDMSNFWSGDFWLPSAPSITRNIYPDYFPEVDPQDPRFDDTLIDGIPLELINAIEDFLL